MRQPCFWLPAILILSVSNCKKCLSYTFSSCLAPRALLPDSISPFSFRTKLFVSTGMCRHLSLHPQDLGTSFALHWGFLVFSFPAKWLDHFFWSQEQMRASFCRSHAQDLLSGDEKPSLTHFLPSHLLAICLFFLFPGMGLFLSHCAFLCFQEVLPLKCCI